MLVAGAALLAIVPASALARHHRGHHQVKHHRTHHARVRHEVFGGGALKSSSGGKENEAQDNAGTVDSFTNGVLTIKLSDNSTVSGHVTSATEIECQAPEPQETQHMDGDGGTSGGDDNAGANQPTGENENENENQAENENENENEQSCGTSALTLGTVVHEAELKVSSSGSVWENVELVK
jgi:hypothetical protein